MPLSCMRASAGLPWGLDFNNCDNSKYWYVNDGKCLGFSDCVVSHFRVIVTMQLGVGLYRL